ncbi:hypothetical protein ACERII_24450 [Evansella sp. AB-rgal1]|uniref:hypothetical protein n=1 Tax=Evansella sp. AB-rgal1 TaxID=3242696 RepID=UPI00359E70E2
MSKRKFYISIFLGLFLGFFVIPITMNLVGLPSGGQIIHTVLGEPNTRNLIFLNVGMIILFIFIFFFLIRTYKKHVKHPTIKEYFDEIEKRG